MTSPETGAAGTPDTTRYDAAFYADQSAGSLESARVVLPLVFAVQVPQRVVDIGCGQGTWLAVAEALGSTSLTGYDGAWVDRARLASPRIAFTPADLSRPLALAARHDLCISVEVAEHLPASRADGFVADCCAAADLVLFSAAAPLQGGTEHVNEERASRWAARFAANGYDAFDLVRGAVWDDARVAWWYRQNLLVFAKRGTAAHAAASAAPLPPRPVDLVHPEAYEAAVAWARGESAYLKGVVERPTLGQALRGILRAVRRLLTPDR